jgi:hypothetical protein
MREPYFPLTVTALFTIMKIKDIRRYGSARAHTSSGLAFTGIESTGFVFSFPLSLAKTTLFDFQMRDTPFRTSGRVTGEDFFGRQQIIRTVVHQLRGKASVAVIGSPRSGKTSLLEVLFKNYKLAEKDALTWYVDLTNLTTLDDLVNEFYIGMQANVTDTSLATFGQTMRGFNGRLVIFIDSGDRFAQAPFNEEAFFALLATYLQRQHISICLTTTLVPDRVFTNRIGLPLQSFFLASYLDPLTFEEALTLIQKKLEWTGIFFSDSEINQLYMESGGHAGDFQKLAADLYRQRMLDKESGKGGSRIQMFSTGSDKPKKKQPKVTE